MDAFLMRLFPSQDWTQCRFALISYDEYNTALAVRLGRAGPGTTTGPPTVLGEDFLAQSAASFIEPALRVWHPAQAFLTATANVSKALWGQIGNFARAREPLRKSLQVTDSSPLRQTTMRNNFDHFDERLHLVDEVARPQLCGPRLRQPGSRHPWDPARRVLPYLRSGDR